MSAFTAAYMLVLIGGIAAADWLVDARELPDETSQGVYGVLVVAAAAFVALTSSGGMPAVVAVVGLLAAFGGWTVLDAYTAFRYEDDDTHAFLRGVDDDGTEAMLRMQTMNAVNQELKNADGPRTPSELADALDMTETRVEPALSYLASKGHAERVEDGYRATPPRWGRLHPVVAFARWLPRRVLAPARRLRV
ncbi:TrmB family transcriptional regulator [Salarchaeum sp. JOR-1]|uniref:TrmB family transcriptional regulator n=1 Tax=Salarchaeum sp. JOR-1 TaxID=2599399 RepID=UPI00143E026B|nr:TrmB family transcriptional regulator [Salarchaeum sp. JOR-1]